MYALCAVRWAVCAEHGASVAGALYNNQQWLQKLQWYSMGLTFQEAFEVSVGMERKRF